MNRWKLAVPVIAALTALFATGCVAEERVVVQQPQQAPQPVEVQSAPPPEQIEVIPVAPRPDYTWIRGHWHWTGARWIWTPGRYESYRRGYRWVPAHYENRRGRYYYVPGHWGR